MVIKMQDEHELTERLLPWFVNGTLAPDELDRVQCHVECCETCRDSVTLLSAIQSAVRHDTAVPIALPPRADGLLDAIDRAAGRKRRRRILATSLLAASIAAVVLAGMLLPINRDRSDSQPALYETITSPTRQVSMDYVFDLQFQPGTTLADQTQVLRELEARDIEQLRQDSSYGYRVTVNLSVGSLEELDRYTDEIAARPHIKSMQVVALQLPMQRKQ